LPETAIAFPAFVGLVGASDDYENLASLADGPQWKCVWQLFNPKFELWIRNGGARRSFLHHSAPDDEIAPSVFISGQPFVAGDSEFSTETRVERIAPPDLPHRVASLYQERGTQAFALLEGHFCLVVSDPASQSIFLVVDKFGCDDVYVRRQETSLAFASHPSLITDPSTRFDARATGFFLAHEGFVPAPFTLFDSIQTVGRAKFLRIRMKANRPAVESERYWNPSQITPPISSAVAVDQFHRVLDAAVEPRCRLRNGLLLSGGIDSSLLANLIASRKRDSLLAITGAVRGHTESELEVRRAAALSSVLGIAHESVYLDPRDQALPDEWIKCTASWSGGTRITLPIFYRIAARLSERFGAEHSAFSGQMADTLADNNYTLPSLGYTCRRMFFSSWFLKVMHIARMAAPRKNSRSGILLTRFLKACAGPRISQLVATMSDGLTSNSRFYEGRVFGFGEMPGRSSAAFPVLSENGFEEIADWYSSNFVTPVISQLTPETFYQGMIELSMDMVMLHLDTRLALHALRLGCANPELPFLDSRVVNFFAGLPYSARAFYRRPKYVIDAQFKKRNYVRTDAVESRESQAPRSQRTDSFEEILLAGSLGAYFRELLRRRNALDHVPGLDDFIDEGYFERQVRGFLLGQVGVDYKFVCRIAALELWTQTRYYEAPSVPRAAAIA
jgi:hypothetical protein